MAIAEPQLKHYHNFNNIIQTLLYISSYVHDHWYSTPKTTFLQPNYGLIQIYTLNILTYRKHKSK